MVMLVVEVGLFWQRCLMVLWTSRVKRFNLKDYLNDKKQLRSHILKAKLFTSTKRVITHKNSPQFHLFFSRRNFWIPPAL